MLHLTRRSRSRLRASSAAAVEAMESRVLLSTYMVNNTLDSGPGSLRDDVHTANASPGADTIMFAPGLTGTIALTSGAIEIADDVAIVGPGAGSLTISGGNGNRVFSIDQQVTASISGLTITNPNTTGYGGGISNMGSALTVTACVLTGDSNANNGGAIYNLSGTLTVSDTTIAKSHSDSDGGGIFSATGMAVLLRDTFANNTCGSDGGAVAGGGTIFVANSTFTRNQAESGASCIDSFATLTVTNSTLSGNSGTAIHGTQPPALNNTIVAGNFTDLGGRFTGSNNLIGNPTGSSGLTNGVNGNIVGVSDPKLAPFGDYGGPTQTMPPLYGSLAIDAGNNALAVGPDDSPLATDQRGTPRIIDATLSGTPIVDIGAVELPPISAIPLIVNTTADGAVGFPNPAHLSLRDAVSLADSLHGDHTITFAPGLAGTIALSANLAPIEVSNTTGEVTVDGPGMRVLTIEGQNSAGVFQVDQEAKAKVDGLSFAGTGGVFTTTGSILTSGALELDNCSVSNGGVHNFHGTISLNHCIVSNNTNASGGGGVRNVGTGTISDCTITGNQGNLGGGVYNLGSLTVTRCVITGNMAPVVSQLEGGGAGIYNGPNSTMVVSECLIGGNNASASSGGSGATTVGGAGIENLGSLQLFNCTVTRACYELPVQFASRASMTIVNAAKCIPFSVDARRS